MHVGILRQGHAVSTELRVAASATGIQALVRADGGGTYGSDLVSIGVDCDERRAMRNYRVTWRLENRSAAFAGTLAECVRWADGCEHMSGPNGPVHSLELYDPDGRRVDDWDAEIIGSGMVPLYRYYDELNQRYRTADVLESPVSGTDAERADFERRLARAREYQAQCERQRQRDAMTVCEREAELRSVRLRAAAERAIALRAATRDEP